MVGWGQKRSLDITELSSAAYSFACSEPLRESSKSPMSAPARMAFLARAPQDDRADRLAFREVGEDLAELAVHLDADCVQLRRLIESDRR